jgi:hypothetical protein
MRSDLASRRSIVGTYNGCGMSTSTDLRTIVTSWQPPHGPGPGHVTAQDETGKEIWSNFSDDPGGVITPDGETIIARVNIDQDHHAVATKAAKDEYTFDVQYDIVRRERIGLPRAGQQPQLVKASAKEASAYLAPDKLVPTTGKLADIAAQQVQGRTGTMDQSRALYNYVFTTMKYDKTGTGGGHGDAEWACDSKRGNCTDFHSVFISMARSLGIPARFEIGFPIPANKTSGDIAGYHCWAEFYDSQYGWVPVDISEAWKDQTKKDYFFGAHDVNRVQFSMGRDLVLNPPQAGEPLNYFVYPYVEVDGKKWENVSNHFSFADVVSSAGAGK